MLYKIMEKRNCDNIVLQKDIMVDNPIEKVDITIPSEEMKIGKIINKPVDYWYEVELNPDTSKTQTIIGYSIETGAKILTLLPEGADKE